jgi:hypothetical protein
MDSSNQPSSVGDLVRRYTDRYADLWRRSPTSLPDLGRTYTRAEQSQREAQLEDILHRLVGELRAIAPTLPEDDAALEPLVGLFAELAQCMLDLGDSHVAFIHSRDYRRALLRFFRDARRFDSRLAYREIYQASRNAAAMNGLQTLLGRPVELTPSIFAYSLLYPYTDNYLDDPGIPGSRKQRFNERLSVRLRGERITADDAREEPVYRLLSMIEKQHPRERSPQVFESLLAIHAAQIESLRLLDCGRPLSAEELIAIGVAKGGASVLADGYLVAGTLSPEEADFMFAYGVFLQFSDDLQDVEDDLRAGLRTPISQAARDGPLDAWANRTLHFGHRVLARLELFPAPDLAPFKDLVRLAAVHLPLAAACRAETRYTRDYLISLGPHLPISAPAMRGLQHRLRRHRDAILRRMTGRAAP